MPTYSYVCRRCQKTFERFQKMSDKPIRKCPECGGRAERQITGGGGILFKGDGFYCTDYRSEEYKRASRKEKSSETSTSSSSKASESKAKASESKKGGESK